MSDSMFHVHKFISYVLMEHLSATLKATFKY